MILSPSYLTEFFDCPRRYYYSQICRLPAPPDAGEAPIVRPTGGTGGDGLAISPQDLGTAFHRFMELLPAPQEWRMALTQALRETLSPELQETAAELMTEWPPAMRPASYLPKAPRYGRTDASGRFITV